MSLGACISRWPVTTRSPWFENSLGPRNSSSTEASASFICRNSGSCAVTAEQQRDPRAGAHAADSDHLAGEVGQPELLEQHRGGRIRASRGNSASAAGATRASRRAPHPERADRSGRSAADSSMIRASPSTTCVSFEKAVMLSLVRALATLLRGPLHELRLELRPSSCSALSISRREYHTSRFFMAANSDMAVAVPPTVSSTIRACVLGAEAVVARGDQHARRQPLDVPLPRPGQRLVEVVDVEHQPPLGRGEHAEVRQVRVPAALDGQPRSRRRREVAGHDQRRAAIERERRDEHAAVADRHQLGDTRRPPAARAARPGRAGRPALEHRVARAWHLGPRGLAARDPLR